MVNQNNLTPVKTIKGKENEKKETVVVSTPLKKVTVIAQDEEVWDLFTRFFFLIPFVGKIEEKICWEKENEYRCF